ncbi:PepSY-associated TM helix domain-containing protein [Paludisphaera mucosa]|uniref:PepSY domain-containing protein n=1 Tax=Paludisphaera mucosa TaxID=3030827 RepID=A0ABT6FC59_9BACT|nr:PepSY domain-containing protein [Paludisphaera mucosa]MDG3005178.1 PepSY domain-containing protein [Paludisphaera mucosa]
MTESKSNGPGEAAGWPDYRAVWRWHFYAGLFCVPFVVVLSISGSIYLFKQEIESWIDRPYDGLSVRGRPEPPSKQVAAALAAFPGASFHAYELPQADDESTRVIVRRGGEALRVYVHPESLRVLHAVVEEDRLMRRLFRLHGELLMGDRGSAIVELASSWAIVMIVTGLFLWWPRGARRLGGVLYPRLGRGSRIFWRDLHAATGLWVSGFALVLLLTGLPWAKFWGDYFRGARRLTGTAVARQDWTNGAVPRAMTEPDGGHAGHGGARGGRGSGSRPTADLAALDRIAATVGPLRLPPPVVIAPPEAPSTGGPAAGSLADWTARSMTANRPYRVDLVMDGATGAIKGRKGFGDRHPIDRIVGVGIALHEGRLFGPPNQLLGLATAAGLVLLSVSSVVLWLRRRDPGTLGAPRPLARPAFAPGLLLTIFALGVYLPLFGASLLAVLAAEKLILGRIPSVSHWLGLQTSRA